MIDGSKFSILVVDDEVRITRILNDLFRAKGYKIHIAHNGRDALQIIENQCPDMVISDINMPGMDGFELLTLIDEKYPDIKRILMTSYDIDQYISIVRKHNIGNVLVKGPDFLLHEVDTYVQALLTGNIFGLDRYFQNAAINKIWINTYSEAKKVCTEISELCPESIRMFIEIAIDELISNAVFHGILALTNTPRELWQDDYVIDSNEKICISWVKDDHRIGVAVEDPKGNLKKMDVLRWLEQREDEPRGETEHGRGLFLVRKLIDRFIINIDPGKRTECIIIQNFETQKSRPIKPLIIHEL